MISIASLQRTVAVAAVLLGLCFAEVWLFTRGQQLLPGTVGRVANVAFAFGLLAFFGKLTSWERKRRLQDDEAVKRVVGAARSAGVEIPEDRAIFPIFYRGHKKPQT
jgi:hypothetical protein